MKHVLLKGFLTVTSLLSISSSGVDDSLPPHAGRTAEERKQVAVVERFGGAAGDRRRLDFDYWNLQLIREDAAVSTVFLGDSITEFWAVEAYFRPAGGLIVNRGISSDTASNMVRRFEADVLQLRPRNVVILAGDNDISLAPAGKSDDELVKAITANFEQMVRAARTARIRVLFCSIPPMTAGPAGHARYKAIVPRINERLRALAKASDTVFVEYARAMADKDGDLRPELTGDGLHPNDAGYRVMADTLRAAVATKGIRL